MAKSNVLIALGGNALDVKEKDLPNMGIDSMDQRAEYKVARKSMEAVGELLKTGEVGALVLTHGNGPQVGKILAQQELTKNQYPRMMPLDVCVADSQGRIGASIQNVLTNVCMNNDINRKVVTLVTQVEVDPQDQAFKNPTKPIGSFFTEENAKAEMQRTGAVFKEDAGRGWRKVVPSPQPKIILEKEVIEKLYGESFIVVAGGGGGIPVMRNEMNEIRGVEAVLDKDRTSSLMANELGADIFIVLTEAPFVSLNYNTPEQVDLKEVGLAEMQKYMDEGHFAEGSMKPKVEAAMNFVRRGGKKAIIANLFQLVDAFNGKVGTHIVA